MEPWRTIAGGLQFFLQAAFTIGRNGHDVRFSESGGMDADSFAARHSLQNSMRPVRKMQPAGVCAKAPRPRPSNLWIQSRDDTRLFSGGGTLL